MIVVVGGAAAVYFLLVAAKGRLSGTAIERVAEASGLAALGRRGGRVSKLAASRLANQMIGVRGRFLSRGLVNNWGRWSGAVWVESSE